MIILVTESTDGIELAGSGVAISVLEGVFEGSGGGVTDHGALTGLTDDDHPQYHNDARGDARYDALGDAAAAQAAAEATAGAALATHAADTTSVHGIADTAALATDAEVATAVADHAAAANPHPTYLTQAEGDAAYDALGAAAAAQTAAEATASGALTTHAADTTAVHGIADTSALATTASVTTAISAHEADTTSVHGIADTSALVTTSTVGELARDAVGTALTDGSGVDVVVDDAGDTITVQRGPVTVNAQTGTTYTLVLADAPKFVTMSNASASTLTVPPNSSVAFPTGTLIEGAQLGAGQVTLTPGSGVTINGTPGLKVAAQYGTFGLLKVAADTWLAFGRLSA